MFRINLSGDDVKEAVRTGQLDRIVPHDQLGQQKAQNLVSLLLSIMKYIILFLIKFYRSVLLFYQNGEYLKKHQIISI